MTESTEIVPIEGPLAANPLDISPEAFRGALARRGDNRKALMDWIRSSLVRGTDYGRIHVMSKSRCDKGNQCTIKSHFSKDCLFKPGAEKIAGMLGVTATFPTFHKYEEAALAGVEIKQIILRCHMLDSLGRIVADGIGARSLEQDYGDINKALKMCSKSAHIDATLRMAGLSEVFTQDIDQMMRDNSAREDLDPPPATPEGIPNGPEFVPSGRHQGKKWSEVGGDYLSAIIKGDKASKSFKTACQVEIDRRAKLFTGGITEDSAIPYEAEAGVRG